MLPEEPESPEEHESLEEHDSPEDHDSPEERESLEEPKSPEEPESLEEHESPEEHLSDERANVLARLIDPDALASCVGARGKLSIEVPAAWLVGAVELAITAPARIMCARCDGGGCDGCDRSGALRCPVDGEARTLSVRLPRGAGDGAVLRLVRPFGVAAPIDQLLVEVRPSVRASVGVARIDPEAALASAPRSLQRGGPWALMILALVTAVIAFLVTRWARGS